MSKYQNLFKNLKKIYKVLKRSSDWAAAAIKLKMKKSQIKIRMLILIVLRVIEIVNIQNFVLRLKYFFRQMH